MRNQISSISRARACAGGVSLLRQSGIHSTELRIQVILHKQKNLAWPVAETNSHWIIIGLDKDLNAAMTMAARNAIKFLAGHAKISELAVQHGREFPCDAGG